VSSTSFNSIHRTSCIHINSNHRTSDGVFFFFYSLVFFFLHYHSLILLIPIIISLSLPSFFRHSFTHRYEFEPSVYVKNKNPIIILVWDSTCRHSIKDCQPHYHYLNIQIYLNNNGHTGKRGMLFI